MTAGTNDHSLTMKKTAIKAKAKAKPTVAKIKKIPVPSVSRTGDVVSITHREFVGTLVPALDQTYATTALSFQIPGYDLTPSNSTLFPWLSRVAVGFETFKISDLKVKLVSYQPSTATGAVYVGADPDWQDEVPSNKILVLGLGTSTSRAVWESFDFTIPIERFQGSMPWRYLSNSATRSPGEPRTSNYGFLLFGTDCSIDYKWDIFVQYSIQFKQPTVEAVYSSSRTETGTKSVYPAASDTGGAIYPVLNVPSAVTPNQVGIDLASSLISNQTTRCVIPVKQALKDFAIDSTITPAGASPLDVIVAGAHQILTAYDAAGTVLASYAYDANGYTSTVGVSNPATIDTDDEPLHLSTQAFMSLIKANYPTLAYIVPSIVGLAASAQFTYGNNVFLN
nr:MAG: putative coat protein [Nodaviridae sp.]